jgi:hypothetical protein
VLKESMDLHHFQVYEKFQFVLLMKKILKEISKVRAEEISLHTTKIILSDHVIGYFLGTLTS